MTSPAEAITSAVRSVTKVWARQRKAEERNRNAVSYRRMRLVRSHRTTLREAAFDVMEQAYSYASDGGKLPVKPRQIMYAARPQILRRTGQLSLSGQYFSQILLIDYMEEYYCSDWDIIWDARGHFAEPHTRCEIPLGTLEVRQYLGERPSFDPPRHELSFALFPTAGPQNRYSNVLFIEKEGFHPILTAAHLQERLDVALMSTKGMSVTASRMLLDRLADDGVNVFVLHDFDVAGFSIFGTLGTDSRRYAFNNFVSIVDIGLRLTDVRERSLQSEPVPIESTVQWRKRAATLRRHGATTKEIEFLQTQRVELNAMTSRQFVDFVEAKLAAHGVVKLIPDDTTLEEQARPFIRHQLTQQALAKLSDKLAKQAETAKLPKNLRALVAKVFKKQPEMPWDEAVAHVINASSKRTPSK
jgi:hypothetical protein